MNNCFIICFYNLIAETEIYRQNLKASEISAKWETPMGQKKKFGICDRSKFSANVFIAESYLTLSKTMLTLKRFLKQAE